MSDWLSPVRSALDAAAEPVRFFVRDDDAGWDDEALWRLLDRCEAHRVNIDLAVIPIALAAPLAAKLCRRAAGGLVHLHQHGFRHLNHELTGRKCEFGPSRSHEQQLADIADGRQTLADLLHPFVEPIFTPPWNRCTDDTASALVDLDFAVLSCDRSADRFGLDGLTEVPITVDWFGKSHGEPLTREQIATEIAGQITAGGPLGIMLHHAVTDTDDLQLIDELLTVLGNHSSAVSTSIYSSSL